jgi:hypothetical protein
MCEQFSEDEPTATGSGEGVEMGHLDGQKIFMPRTSRSPLTLSVPIVFQRTKRKLSVLIHSKNPLAEGIP